MSDSKGTKKGRDAITGQFRTVEFARRNPNTTVVEVVKKPSPPKKK